MAQEKSECDVLVIGAGLAGLSAADEITQLDNMLNVIVLEAKGKRIFTIN